MSEREFEIQKVPDGVPSCKHDVSCQQVLWDGEYFVKCNICGFFTELEP